MVQQTLLKEGERLDLLVREQLHIIQNPAYFSFSVDAILLAEFANVPRRKTARILDLCSGNGVVPLLLSHKTEAQIVGVELQAALVDMARRSCAMNQLENQVHFMQQDVKELSAPEQLYDTITCNPPYFSVANKQMLHHLDSHAIARHEVCLTLAEWVGQARKQLKDRGKLFCVYRPDRLDDLIEVLLQSGFAIHRLQFVYAKAGQTAKIVLVEAICQGGRQGVQIEPPIVIYTADNQYTDEMQAIYYGK